MWKYDYMQPLSVFIGFFSTFVYSLAFQTHQVFTLSLPVVNTKNPLEVNVLIMKQQISKFYNHSQKSKLILCQYHRLVIQLLLSILLLLVLANLLLLVLAHCPVNWSGCQ